MSDLTLAPPPPRAQLLRQLRGRLGELVASLRLVAEGLLGAEAPIDFVGVEPSGRITLILVGDDGQDLELVGRALAQRRWVEARARDWLQLAPGLGIRPEAGVRVVLLCARFQPETLAAARALGSGVLELAHYRCVRNGTGVDTLVEAVWTPTASQVHQPGAQRTAEPPPPPFRTGLTDADLGLTPEEQREFGPATPASSAPNSPISPRGLPPGS
ncbi:MAG: hypothetical protein V3U03_09875 [Myxococcota bacterium]